MTASDEARHRLAVAWLIAVVTIIFIVLLWLGKGE